MYNPVCVGYIINCKTIENVAVIVVVIKPEGISISLHLKLKADETVKPLE